ncbi:MAG: hypothetical protein AWU57_3536, partial [Marinobacter sp. T13-3]
SVYVLGADHPNSKSIVLKAVAGRPEEAITLNPMLTFRWHLREKCKARNEKST